MNKIMRTLTGMAMGIGLLLSAGCTDDENSAGNNSGTGSQEAPGTEGIYLGIIGFNDQQYVKEIGYLNTQSVADYTSFIGRLSSGNGTGLYYADYTALQKMKAYAKPPKLQNVVLVTFTDGLDNISLADDSHNPGNYASTAAYREALHDMITHQQIHGVSVSAYTIGLKGSDVTDDAMFAETLNKLASSENNVFQVSDMNEAMQRFTEIAENLNSVNSSVSMSVNVPGGYDDGQLLRFTFDNATSATASSIYIEATFRRSNGRTLDNITYHGFAQGATSISSSSSQGAYHLFRFENLAYADGSPVPETALRKIMLWKQTSTGGWDKETEFDPASSTDVTVDKNSALIMLVLDCTTSLGSDFSNMQRAATSFVQTLAYYGGDNGSGSNGNVLLQEDFSGNIFNSGWSVQDVDGDGNTWNLQTDYNDIYSPGYDFDIQQFLASQQNVLYTPSIFIPSSGTFYLKYKVASAYDNWPATYRVIALQGSNRTVLFDGTATNGEGHQDENGEAVAGAGYKTKKFSLAAFSGQNITIAFEHYGGNSIGLMIDDVEVYKE